MYALHTFIAIEPDPVTFFLGANAFCYTPPWKRTNGIGSSLRRMRGRAVVLGGSIAGLGTALGLARQGFSVSVIERDAGPVTEIHW